MERILVAGILLIVVAALSVLARRRQARMAGYQPPVPRLPLEWVPEAARGRLAVLAFKSRLCSECQETPAVVAEALQGIRGVAYVPVDVAERPDLARRLDLAATPTVLLVDAGGRVRFACAGNPEAATLRFFVREALASSALERTLRLPR